MLEDATSSAAGLDGLLRAAALLTEAPPAALLTAVSAAVRAVAPDHVRAVRLYLPADSESVLPAAHGLVLRAAEPPPDGAGPYLPPAVVAAFTEGREVLAPAAGADGMPDGATTLLLPLPAAGATGGVLVVDLAGPPPALILDQFRLLATQLGLVLEMTRLRRAALRDEAADRLLEQIGADVASTLSLNEILGRILTHLSQAISFTGGSIALINTRHELEIVAAVGEIDETARQVRLAVGEGISGWVAAGGHPYLSNDLDHEDHIRPAARDVGSNRLMHSYMAVPLRVEGAVIGVLQVNHHERDAFSLRGLALLAEVGGRCASAVAQARMFAELRARTERLAILNAIGRRISAKLDLDELFVTGYEQVRRVMAADAFFVALYDAAAGMLRYEFEADSGTVYPKSQMPFGDGLTSHVVRTAEALVANRRDEWASAAAAIPFGSGQDTQSLLIVPLIFERRVLGAVSVQSYETSAYSEEDLRLFTTLASQMATAIRNAELYQSERAAQRAKDEFLSLISHELKTPLTAIRGMAQMVIRRILKAYSAGQVTDPAQDAARHQDMRALQVIVGQVDRLTRLVDDLLDISRFQSGRFELFPGPADLTAVARGVLDTLRPTSPEHRLLLEAPPTVPGVFDPLRIEQVLNNLISNAVKYTPAGTEIRVTITLEGESAVVCVRDEGPGLTAEEQARIFDQYVRAEAGRRDPTSGVGLGLFISRQLVEYHGGQIWVHSAPGMGSRFCFRLPLDGVAAATHRQREPTDAG